jgi:hypothetical protein
VQGGLVAAILSLLVLTFGSQSALADPIGGPWIGDGHMIFEDGLGGTECDVTMEGFTDGNSMNAVSFFNCVGALGTPIALPTWNVTWNAFDTGGTITMAFLVNLVGIARCLYVGTVPFAYSFGAFHILPGSVAKVSGPMFPCPATKTVSFSADVL